MDNYYFEDGILIDGFLFELDEIAKEFTYKIGKEVRTYTNHFFYGIGVDTGVFIYIVVNDEGGGISNCYKKIKLKQYVIIN